MLNECRVRSPVVAAVSASSVRPGVPPDEILLLSAHADGRRGDVTVPYAEVVRSPTFATAKFRNVVVQGNLTELLHSVFAFTAQEGGGRKRRIHVTYDAPAFLRGDYALADNQTRQIYMALATGMARHPLYGPASFVLGSEPDEVLARLGDPRQFRKPATRHDQKLRTINSRFSLFPSRVAFAGGRPVSETGDFCLSDHWWPKEKGRVSPMFLAYCHDYSDSMTPRSVVTCGRKFLRFMHVLLDSMRLNHPELVVQRPPCLTAAGWEEFKSKFGRQEAFKSLRFAD